MNKQLLLAAILLVVFLGSVLLGTNVALGDYEQLSGYVIAFLVIFFVVKGWQYAFAVCSFLVLSGVRFHHGFAFGSEHLVVFVFAAAYFLSFFHSSLQPIPQLYRDSAGFATRGFLLLLVAFGIVHIATELVYPLNPGAFSMRRAAKVYFSAFAAPFCLWVVINTRYEWKLPRNWSAWLIVIVVGCLLLNVGARLFLISRGYGDVTDDGTQSDEALAQFIVPVLNMYPGLYALRSLCPIATVLGLIFLTQSGWFRSQSQVSKILTLSVFPLAALGAVVSGGRGTLFICGFVVVLVLLFRRKWISLAGIFALSFMIFAFANLFSASIEKAPRLVSRSLELLIIGEGEASGSINSSSIARKEAFKESIDAWKSGSREMIWGRSVLKVDAEEISFLRSAYGFDAFPIIAVLTGATHNLLSDLLLHFGILGTILYLGSWLIVIAFFWRVVGRSAAYPTTQSLMIGGCVVAMTFLIYGLIGGAWMLLFLPVVAALGKADAARVDREEEEMVG